MDAPETTPINAESTLVGGGFSSAHLPPQVAFEIWRESLAPICDTISDDLDHFFAEVHGYNLGTLVIGRSRSSMQRFERTAQRRRRDQVDHILVQLCLGGGYGVEQNGRCFHVRPHDVGVYDLSRDIYRQTSRFDTISLLFSRDQLHRVLGKAPDFGGALFSADSAMGRILGNHIETVWNTLPSVPEREAGAVANSLIGALAASLGTVKTAEIGSPVATATRDAILSYIERNLESPELDPAHLCRAFRCSRSFLYRLFESEGGIARHIQRCRLRRCYRELTQPGGPKRRIGDMAFRFGFTNQSHFSRLFQQYYGIAPKQAAAQAYEIQRQRARHSGEGGDTLAVPVYRDLFLNL